MIQSAQIQLMRLTNEKLMITISQKVLFDKYPTLFRQVGLPASESCMTWGIECNVGWLGIIDKLSEALINAYGDKVEYAQIKEKWGVLSVHIDRLDDTIDFMDLAKLKGEYEAMSSHICKYCGNPGSSRYIKGCAGALCDVHFKEISESK